MLPEYDVILFSSLSRSIAATCWAIISWCIASQAKGSLPFLDVRAFEIKSFFNIFNCEQAIYFADHVKKRSGNFCLALVALLM